MHVRAQLRVVGAEQSNEVLRHSGDPTAERTNPSCPPERRRSLHPVAEEGRHGLPGVRRTLTQKLVGDLSVDVCEGGCGGIWFDHFELKKVDEHASRRARRCSTSNAIPRSRWI